jgi:hypothetical protein
MTPIIIPLKINKYNAKKIKFNIPPKNDTLLFLDGEGLNTGKKVPIEVPITESPQQNRTRSNSPSIKYIISGLYTK